MGDPVALRADTGLMPEWLRQVIAKSHADQPPAELRQAEGRVGELVVAAGPNCGMCRVVLITGRDGDTLSVLLATNLTEMATDLDVVVTRARSTAPYDLLVQGELYGPIFAHQVGGLVGSIPPRAAQAMGRGVATDGESVTSFAAGPPLGGADDPRRRFKEEELGDLMALVTPCRQWLAAGTGPKDTP